jgi:hypothetical protein
MLLTGLGEDLHGDGVDGICLYVCVFVREGSLSKLDLLTCV